MKIFRVLQLVLTLSVTAAGCSASGSPDAAVGDGFWIWNRSTPLSSEEAAGLRGTGASKLFWHVGEVTCSASRWSWRTHLSLPSSAGFLIVPVVRLNPQDANPFSSASLASLRALLHDFVQKNGTAELQLDYDCPDRLVGEYATALGQLKTIAPRLSATALAHWIRHPKFAEFASNVTEIVPMFYDLEPDPPSEDNTPRPLPLLDGAALHREFAAWRQCPTSWRAGLPNFCRVTLYDAAGKFRGHLRAWNWNDVCFNAALHHVGSSDGGVTALRATAPTSIGGSDVGRGEWVVVRQTQREALAAAIRTARENNAAGVVYFRLPDENDSSGWSLAQLKNLTQLQPHLVLRQEASDFQLTNESDTDLPPRFGNDASDPDRGYAIEIDASGPVWREAAAGEFWRVTGHVAREENTGAVAIPLATRLTFWFSHLRAGATLRTGLVELAPNARSATLRYRILSAGDEAAEWRSLQ